MKMKQLFFIVAVLGSYVLHAQQNIFLDPTFWKNNPDLATVKAEVEKGNNPAELNRMSFDPVVYAINGQAPNDAIKFLIDQN